MEPTRFADLNGVLDELVDGARAALGASFVGAYLVGSFAIGDADEHSDADFIVVTAEEPDAEQVERLQALHARLYGLGPAWAQHLEGSYVPAEQLAHVDPDRTAFFFLENGASELRRDDHCNKAHVRRVLRERGVVLAGPAPKTLVASVTRAELDEEAHVAAREYLDWALGPDNAEGMSQWTQPYLVLTFCRILAVLAQGDVVSKRAAGEWALANLDPEWHDLIARALADRPDPWGRVHRRADPELVARTRAFASYAFSKTKGP